MINWQTLQAQLPLLDDYQLERMDQELGLTVVARLLRLFVEDSQQLGESLLLAFQNSDFVKMAANCHSLKSACGSYGALRCQYLSEKLEESCDQQDDAKVAELFQAWQSALSATLMAVQERLAGK